MKVAGGRATLRTGNGHAETFVAEFRGQRDASIRGYKASRPGDGRRISGEPRAGNDDDVSARPQQ
jgi:hypothetical protein